MSELEKNLTWEDVKHDPNAIRIHEHGFIVLKETMGSDQTVVESARISYGKGTKTASDDRNLIRYMMRHSHTSPFEQVECRFLVKVPLFIWQQWLRHRTANINQLSGRYSEMPSEYYHLGTEWRQQSKNNKQGGEEPLHYVSWDHDGFGTSEEISQHEYDKRLESGMSRELARSCLPCSQYTIAYWKCDLRNIFNFLRLRMDPHAQKEIRDFANAMYELLKPRFPLCIEAFEDYELKAVKFSRMEMEFLRSMIKNHDNSLDDSPYDTAKLIEKYCPDLSKREIEEFKAKLGVS